MKKLILLVFLIPSIAWCKPTSKPARMFFSNKLVNTCWKATLVTVKKKTYHVNISMMVKFLRRGQMKFYPRLKKLPGESVWWGHRSIFFRKGKYFSFGILRLGNNRLYVILPTATIQFSLTLCP